MKAHLAQQVERRFQRRLDERGVVYLLGAGASVCAGLPTMHDLTVKIHRGLPPDLKEHYDTIRSALQNQLGEGRCLNIEDILSELLLELARQSVPQEHRTTELFTAITSRVRRLLQSTSTFDHHRRFVKALCAREGRTVKRRPSPITIATTNYDLLVETSCEAEQIAWTNGFGGTFRRTWIPGCLACAICEHSGTEWRPIHRQVLLMKVHGSLSWHTVANGETRETAQVPTGLRAEQALMIWPHVGKEAAILHPPFNDLLKYFERALGCATVLATSGYGYGDEHLNGKILEWAKAGNGRSLVCMSKELPVWLSPHREADWLSVLTEDAIIWNGRVEQGKTDLWDFARFSLWLESSAGG